jgi:hypothetical protein
VDAVVVTPSAASRWRRIVVRATGARPVRLGQAAVYRVTSTLPLLHAVGDLVVAHAADADPRLASDRDTRRAVSAWLAFDGRRAQVRALLRTSKARAVTLSSANGDSDATTAAVDDRGHVAVAFTEWRDHKQTLRVATHANGRWQVVTLDKQSAAIWSPHVVITPGGTTVVAWIDGTDPTRTIRAAVLRPGGAWERPFTLENGNGFGNVVLSAGQGDRVVVAWHLAVANEWRVRVATYQHGAWNPVSTLARSLDLLDHIAIAGRNATSVGWLERVPHHARVVRVEARRGKAGWIVVSRSTVFDFDSGVR